MGSTLGAVEVAEVEAAGPEVAEVAAPPGPEVAEKSDSVAVLAAAAALSAVALSLSSSRGAYWSAP